MRIILALIFWMIPPAIIGLSACSLWESEFEKMFNREAALAKTCGVDRAVSTVPLRVYRFKDQLWFKDNSVWRPVAAGIDQVCDVLDVDARRSSRNNCGRC
jgi:hypothetical protein